MADGGVARAGGPASHSQPALSRAARRRLVRRASACARHLAPASPQGGHRPLAGGQGTRVGRGSRLRSDRARLHRVRSRLPGRGPSGCPRRLVAPRGWLEGIRDRARGSAAGARPRPRARGHALRHGPRAGRSARMVPLPPPARAAGPARSLQSRHGGALCEPFGGLGARWIGGDGLRRRVRGNGRRRAPRVRASRGNGPPLPTRRSASAGGRPRAPVGPAGPPARTRFPRPRGNPALHLEPRHRRLREGAVVRPALLVLVLLGLMLPFEAREGLALPGGFVLTNVEAALAAYLLLSWCSWWLSRKRGADPARAKPTGEIWALAIWIALLMASALLASSAPGASLKFAARLAVGPVLLWSARRDLSEPRARSLVVGALLLGGALAAVAGLAETYRF